MPPAILPRALQVSRTLKTLNERGWQCEVVTSRPEDVGARLDERLGQFYEGYYDRVLVDVGANNAYMPLHRRIARRLNSRAANCENRFLHRGQSLVIERLRKRDCEVFITFGQPWVDHIIGLKVKQLYPGLPWLAHFSDPWSDSPYSSPIGANHNGPDAIRKQERAVIEAADAVVFVTKETADLVMRKYPPEWRKKVHVVPHGYDSDLMNVKKPLVRPDNRLYLVHTGYLYRGVRMPNDLLHAIARLNETHRSRNELVVDFIGHAPDECRILSEKLELFGQVRFLGNAEYFTCLAASASADALLLIDAPADNNVFLPSKIVEYMMMGKPVLGLTPPVGASATVLRNCNFPVVAPDDRAGIHEVLARMLEAWRAGTLGIDSARETIASFDIRVTTARFETAIAAAQSAARSGQ